MSDVITKTKNSEDFREGAAVVSAGVLLNKDVLPTSAVDKGAIDNYILSQTGVLKDRFDDRTYYTT